MATYHHAGCCCGGPCTDCGVATALVGSASIENWPDCDPNVCGWCNQDGDNYSVADWGSFTDEDDYCEWVSGAGVGVARLPPTLSIVYWKSTRKWYAIVYDGGNKAGCQTNGWMLYGDIDQVDGPDYVKRYKDITADISCDADVPELVGEFSLAGSPCDNPGDTCEGCTLVVTLS